MSRHRAQDMQKIPEKASEQQVEQQLQKEEAAEHKQAEAEGYQLETHEMRQERSFQAAAHNKRNSDEGRLHAALKFCDLYEKRTGQKQDPFVVAELQHLKGKGLINLQELAARPLGKQKGSQQ